MTKNEEQTQKRWVATEEWLTEKKEYWAQVSGVSKGEKIVTFFH